MLDAVDEARAKLLASKGLNPRLHNAEELLKAAVDAEATCKHIGPFDPAFAYYTQYARDAFAAAELAEKLNSVE